MHSDLKRCQKNIQNSSTHRAFAARKLNIIEGSNDCNFTRNDEDEIFLVVLVAVEENLIIKLAFEP